MAVTRSETKVFLIGEARESFDGRMLPTGQEVLQVYFFHHKIKTLSMKDAIKIIVDEMNEIWLKARVPTVEERSIVRKLETLVQKYRNVCRNKKRRRPAQEARESEFENLTKKLFDIAHYRALDIIKIEEDRQFLKDQRGERKMFMGNIDSELASKECRMYARLEKEEKRKIREKKRNQMGTNIGAGTSKFLNVDMDSDDNALILSCESSGDEFRTESQTQSHEKPLKRRRVTTAQAISQVVAVALDRTNVSNRKAAFILQAAAHSYGHQVSDMPLSPSSIRRSRSQHHTLAAAAYKTSFINEGPLVVHFDGKLLPSIAGGSQKEDRVAVLVTGLEVEKILAIPKIKQGTGELVAKAALESLLEWKLVEKTVGMSFDTTAANTGHLNGACVLLEK